MHKYLQNVFVSSPVIYNNVLKHFLFGEHLIR
jgi:hypothetical protein